MIHNESISEDALTHFNSMDKYLTNPSNINPALYQKQGHPNISIQQSTCFADEIQRSKACVNPNFINQSHFNNVTQPYNRIPVAMNVSPMCSDQLTVHQLYNLSSRYQHIDKLTLSVNNGNLYGPFNLPPDQMITEIEFQLTADSLNQINIREDLDIVLLSRFSKENALHLLSWPSSIKISVNEMPLTLDTSFFNKVPLHLPQYIKKSCLAGRNVVKFEMFDLPKFNYQIFKFHIYMVHRPTIAHSRTLALDSAFVCNDLTNKLLHDNCAQLGRDHVNISTLCPITNKRIEIPIRHKDCTHLQPFDLMGFLKVQARLMLNNCPLCRQNMYFNLNGCQQNIVIDPILQNIFDKMPQDCPMVKICLNGSYGPFDEYLQMMSQSNALNSALQHRAPPFHQFNESSAAMMHQQGRATGPLYRYMAVDPGIQSPPATHYRALQYSGSAPTMTANRSMLDFSPCDIYPGPITPCLKNGQSPTKKAVKRRAPTKKAVAKSVSDAVNCPTPPSTRTSSVASTSSPDSLNVPHSLPKRSPSIDHLSNTVLSESHLNEELLLYSSASSNHVNTIFSDEFVSLPPTVSSSSSFNQPANYYRHFAQHPPWTNDSQTFSRQYRPPSISISSTGNEQDSLTNGSQSSSILNYVDQILTNHEHVPELDDHDSSDAFSLISIDHAIIGLSDIDDF